MEEKFTRITIKNYYNTKTGTLSHLDSSTLRSNCETMRRYFCQTHSRGGIRSMNTVPGSFGGSKRCQDPCSWRAFSPVGKGKLPYVIWAGLYSVSMHRHSHCRNMAIFLCLSGKAAAPKPLCSPALMHQAFSGILQDLLIIQPLKS